MSDRLTNAEEASAWIRKHLSMKCEKQADGRYLLKAGRGIPSIVPEETVISLANSILTYGEAEEESRV